MTQEKTELMTLKEVMEYLQISERTVYRMIEAGELTRYRVGKRNIRFKREEVERLLRTGGK